MSTGNDGKGIIDGKEIRTTRVFDAPRELVWQVWTEPQHVTNWWGPRGFTTTSKSMDVRAGGEWDLVMHGPDGRDYRNRVLYGEVVKPEKLVYRHVGDEESAKPVHFHSEVTFVDRGDGKTEVTMRGVFDSVEDLEYVVKNYHADEGSAQTMARMGEYVVLQKLQTSGVPPTEGATERELTLTRLFNAPRELVWAAWTQPEHLTHWWGPRGYSAPRCEVDLRVGGRMLLVMRGPDGVDMPGEGTILELDPPAKLVFATGGNGPNGQQLLEAHNTVMLAEQDGKTVMTLSVKAKALQPVAIAMLAGMEMGWTQSLEKLEKHVSESAG